MKGHWLKYTTKEIAWLEANRLMVIGDYHRAFCEMFGRTDVSAKHLHALRKRKGWKTGRTGRFEKGAAPHNKGTPCLPDKGGNHPNARATQFRKGARTGAAARNYKPIGTERVSKDGYLERKMHDRLPMQSRWQTVQKINWEAANGPLPQNHVLKCINGDKLDTAPENWAPIPRALLPRLNGGPRSRHLAYDDAPQHLKPTILLAARLDNSARTAKHRERKSP